MSIKIDKNSYSPIIILIVTLSGILGTSYFGSPALIIPITGVFVFYLGYFSNKELQDKNYLYKNKKFPIFEALKIFIRKYQKQSDQENELLASPSFPTPSSDLEEIIGDTLNKEGNRFPVNIYYKPVIIINQTIIKDEESRQEIDKSKTDYLFAIHEHIRDLIDSKDYDKALEKANEFLLKPESKKHEKYYAVLANKGVALYNKGEKEEAAKYYTTSIQIKSDNSTAHVNLAFYYFEKEDMKNALKELDESDRINPNSATSINIRAVILDAKFNKTKEAIELLKKAISIGPKLWEAYANLALFYGKEDNFEEAEKYSLKAIEGDPINGDFHGIYATSLLKKFMSSIEIKATEGEIKFFEKSEFEQKSDYEPLNKIITEYEKAKELGVRDKETLFYNLSSAYFLNKQSQKALELLKDIIQRGNCPPACFMTIAQSYFSIEDWDNALKYYFIIKDKIPNSSSILNSIGLVYMKKGDLLKSIDYLKQAILREPKNSGFYANLGQVYYMNRNYNEAIQQINEAIKLGFTDPNIKLGLARSYVKQKMFANAIVHYKEIYDKKLFPESIKEYANILEVLKRYTEAIPLYKEALKTESDNIQIWMNLARAQYNAREYKDAIDTGNTILQKHIDQTTKNKVQVLIKECENKIRGFIIP